MGLRDAPFMGPIWWYLEWALPGLGMFSEAYIVFSQGQVAPMQAAMWPTCFKTYVDCNANMAKHVFGYITICGIMAGMLTWGFLADITGRKWGSRIVMTIMLSGCILLTFSPYTQTPFGYFAYFVTAQTWYGFGVGGEYPLASSSASERAEANSELRAFRGRQVALVFSNQGLGNLTNACVICAAMAIFGQTGATLDFSGSQKVLILTYGVGACVVAFGVFYRFVFLQESKIFKAEREIELKILQQQSAADVRAILLRRHWVSAKQFWPRQLAASLCWICNDFAFYGNKLQQNLFLTILYPTATSFLKQEWTILNNFIGLLGYYTGAWLIDYPWYGRRRMQMVGFMAMFVFYIIIYAQWNNMGATGAPVAGAHAMQALYYLSSFFNQFGPNVTTWLVAGEIFPTDIRATYHGFAACLGKLGAILSALWISYITANQNVFLISAVSGLIGAFFTFFFLPDTTGLDLSENDRMQRYLLTNRFSEYHGEALNPRHLSPWEIYVLGWHKQYNPELDAVALRMETKEAELVGQADGKEAE